MSLDEILQYAMQRTEYKAKQLVGILGFSEDDIRDVQNDLLADLVSRLEKFDGSLSSAKTFVSRLIANRIVSLIRHRQAGCRHRGRQPDSLHGCVADTTGTWAPRAAVICEDRAKAHIGVFDRPRQEKAELSMDVADVLIKLPPELRQICWQLQRQSIKQTAEDMGVSRFYLYECIRLIRRRFCEAGLDLYV